MYRPASVVKRNTGSVGRTRSIQTYSSISFFSSRGIAVGDLRGRDVDVFDVIVAVVQEPLERLFEILHVHHRLVVDEDEDLGVGIGVQLLERLVDGSTDARGAVVLALGMDHPISFGHVPSILGGSRHLPKPLHLDYRGSVGTSQKLIVGRLDAGRGRLGQLAKNGVEAVAEQLAHVLLFFSLWHRLLL